MSKKKFLQRYKIIISLLKNKKYASFKEIESRLKSAILEQGHTDGYSIRTFQRDLSDIEDIYEISIKYDKTEKAYYIDSVDTDWESNRLMEAFDVMNIIQTHSDLGDIIDFERHTPSGSDHMFGLIHAIKNHSKVSFVHHSYWQEKSSLRTVAPYGIKEYKRRWYLVACDEKDNHIKTFGMDRISEFNIDNKLKFKYPKDFNISKTFEHAYGIILGKENQQPEEIILSFTAEQGKYIKSLPLHPTQKTLIDNEDEFRISIKVYATYDLEMDIRSWGEAVEVIAPETLRQEIKRSLAETNAYYSEVDAI